MKKIIFLVVLSVIMVVLTVSCQTAPSSYHIHYELNGGKLSAGSNPDAFVEGGEPIVLTNPTKNGYVFAGWKDNINRQTAPEKLYVLTTDIASDVVITAYWEPAVYSISYNLEQFDMPKAEEPEEKQTNPVSYTIETPNIELIPAQGSDDYIFVGWIYEGDDPKTATKDFTIYQGSTGDKKIVAVWDFKPMTYYISCRLNGGSYIEKNPYTYVVTDDPFVLNNPVREGYVFIGWREINETSVSEPVLEYTVNTKGHKNLLLEAVWEPINYSIEYVMNGGYYLYDVSNPTVYTVDTETFTLAAPFKYNYKFLGWVVSGDKTLTLHDSFTISKGSTGDLKLYAIFEWIDNPVGAVTEMQLQAEVFGKDNIPRPSWVVKVPSDGEYHYEKGYGVANNFYDSMKLAVKEAVAALGTWTGTYISSDYLEVDFKQELYSIDHSSEAYVYEREIVEYWEDANGGVWVLIRIPVRSYNFIMDDEPNVVVEYREPSFSDVVSKILDNTNIKL